MTSFDQAVHVLKVIGWVALLISGGVLGLWLLFALIAWLEDVHDGAGVAVFVGVVVVICALLFGCGEAGPPAVDAGLDARGDAAVELPAEAPQDTAVDQAALMDRGPEIACLCGGMDNGMSGCTDPCGPMGKCCCGWTDRCQAPLSASECCRK